MAGHYPELKALLGADFIVLDTQQSEKHHKFVGKAAFDNSNKQYGAEMKQMCAWVLAVEGARVSGKHDLFLKPLLSLHNTNTGSSKLHSEMLRLETKSDIEKIVLDVHTDNKFRSTNGTKACKLVWNCELKYWTLPKEFVLEPYFHPCLSQENVFEDLSHSYAGNPGCNMQVWLMQQVRVDPPLSSPDSDEWYTIRCDRKFKIGGRLTRREHSYCSLYSCVTVRSKDGRSPNTLARVLAILKVKVQTTSGEEVVRVSNAFLILYLLLN